MAAFPYTAPRLSEEDRQEEFESLSEEARIDIQNEMMGSDFIANDDDPEMQELGLAQMKEALEIIPVQDKIEYEEALIVAPELVEEESPSIRFLRKHNYNVPAAAQNLVNYWKWRVKLFKQNAFLPMTIQGALKEDHHSLVSGFLQLLPPDNHGRAVFYQEKHRAAPRQHHRDSLCSVLFYFLQLVSSDEKMQRNGFVFVLNQTRIKTQDLDRGYIKQFLSLSDSGGMIKMKALHLISPELWFLPDQLIYPIALHAMPKYTRTRINFYKSASDLEVFGLVPENLPTFLGGTYERLRIYEDWIEKQIYKEEHDDS